MNEALIEALILKIVRILEKTIGGPEAMEAIVRLLAELIVRGTKFSGGDLEESLEVFDRELRDRISQIRSIPPGPRPH